MTLERYLNVVSESNKKQSGFYLAYPTIRGLSNLSAYELHEFDCFAHYLTDRVLFFKSFGLTVLTLSTTIALLRSGREGCGDCHGYIAWIEKFLDTLFEGYRHTKHPHWSGLK